MRRYLLPLSLATTFAVGTVVTAPSVRGQASFNYAEALQKAVFFYEAQISGPKPSFSRVTWRGDSAMQDGADVGRNLTGGWFDAGDHVKFGFAMASSATMLAWGGVEYRDVYQSKSQLTHLLNNLRFVNDYFIRAHTAPNELWGQVGSGGSDHSFWGSAEVMHLRTTRPSARITATCGGSDLAAETAAAMAASSIVFRPTDPTYADTLLTHSRQLFAFAEATHPSFYVDCIPDAQGFYNSRFGNPNDEMAWAAAWLFRATGEAAFLTRARALYATMCKETGTTTPCFTWSQSWNDKHFGTYVMMAQATGEAAFHTDVQRRLDYSSVGVGRTTRTTPGGLMFVDGFGPIRYATNAAFLALVYSDLIGTSHPLYTRYHDFAKRQVDYALGANPRNSSYVVGFGANPPRNPHHRTAHGTSNNNPTGEPNPSRHTLYGGLVGGPDANDAWADNRNDFQRTEVATDFNAGLADALARLALEFGGNPLANFPVAETPEDEIFIDAQINVQGQNFTEIRAFLTNQSAWPSRILSQGTFRYYFTLEPGVTPAQVTLQGNFNQCGSGNLSGPTLFSGSTYFVTVSCVRTNIYPGGQDVFRREVQFRIAVPANVPGNWDTSNDYSFQGLTTSAPTRTRRIVVFDNGVRIWGDEPPAGSGFTLSAAPPSVGVVQGGSIASTINVTRTGTFTGAVTLSASGLPSGVAAAFSSNPVTGASSLVTFTAAANAVTGTFPVTITGTASGQTTQTASIALTVTPAAGFGLSATPPSVSVVRGSTATSTINVASTGGFAGGVTLAASGLPAGVTAAFSPNPATGGTSTLTLRTSSTATLGAATVTGTGTAHGVRTQTTSIGLTVNPAASFTLSASPATVSVTQGSTATSTINVARTGGFAGGVTLAASGLPAGVAAAFSPNPATGATSTLTFTASASATVGGGTVTVTGTASGVGTQTTSIGLTVTPTGDVVTITPVINANGPWFNEEAVRLDNTAVLSALSVTVVIQRTTGVSFSGQYNTVGGQIQQANSSTAAAVTYTWTLAAGQTLGTGTGRLFAAQTSGTGTAHPTAGDTWTVTYTSGGQTVTQSGTFGGGQADFSLSASPTALTVVQGASGTSTITIARTSFTGAVAFTASGLPTGVTASFNPASTTANSSVLTLAASATAATGTSPVTVTGTGGGLTRTVQISLTVSPPLEANAYTQRFLDMWGELHGGNGYFHPANIPYHSVETLMVEAPDHGHQTTSEAFSFWAWLEVMYGRVTGDWTPLQRMFDSMEANIIPTAADQPTNGFYNAGDPADYAPEFDLPSGYPAPIDANIDTGVDPIGAGLQSTYGTPNIYGMHWIIDVDNFYGYGRRGDHVSQPSYMNTFQRGPQESTWETVPHPSWEDFLSGGSTSAGFLPLFITGPAPAQQWRYTNAPDADARLIQAMYWANVFAPGNSTVQALSAKAGRLGDYLRYAFFDKYFKTMGCTSTNCPAGTGYNAAHFLLSWYYAWGGPIPPQGGWAFRIGSSHNHFGYQNPIAAHALVNVPALRPQAPNAVADWTTSLRRQIEFYRWLQSADGGIGGGATNSLGGRYLAPTAPTSTFYGMFYQQNPVYLDPGSNTWFGFQVWSMERVAEYYEETNSPEAKLILDKWIPWAIANTQLLPDGSFLVPSTLAWTGQPSMNWNATTQNWNAGDTTFNANLRVQVTERGTDLGVTAALAKTLIYYSAGTRRWATQHTASQTLAKELLDRVWALFRDPIGVSAPEVRQDYNRFDDPIFVPPTCSGTMANGDPINSASTFIGIRSKYRNDPDWPLVQAYLDGGRAPTLRYHRFWAQVDVALANAEYGRLFP